MTDFVAPQSATSPEIFLFFFVFLFKILRSASLYLVIQISHTDFQMKMEDMPLSGPDNTKLEVSQ